MIPLLAETIATGETLYFQIDGPKYGYPTIFLEEDVIQTEDLMAIPNLFSYATKELSQDAVICWLVSCADKAAGSLRECGLAFVRTLFRAGFLDETGKVPVLEPPDGEKKGYGGPCEVEKVWPPYPQYERIDVYFQAFVDGKTVTFLIEDKTDTTAHSGQLGRNLKSVLTDDEPEDLIKPVYFKTGYLFGDEREEVEANNYSVFEAEDMSRFLQGQEATGQNQILSQYADHLGEQVRKRGEALSKWDFDADHVQWEFMVKLREVLQRASGKWQGFLPDHLTDFQHEWTWKGVGRGKNQGGGPWTQYWFANHLYWRLDSGNPLRMMMCLSNANMSVEDSDDTVWEYRDRFDEALRKEGLAARDLQMKKGNNCTLGSVETDCFQGRDVCEFLDRVKRVHIRFLESVSKPTV